MGATAHDGPVVPQPTMPRPALWAGDGPGQIKPGGAIGPEEGDPDSRTAREGVSGSACREPPNPDPGIADWLWTGTSTTRP